MKLRVLENKMKTKTIAKIKIKAKALYLALVSILILAFLPVSGSLFASKCGQELECPPGIKYPYIFCNPAKTNGIEIVCTDDPIEYERQRRKEDPFSNFSVRKAKLPISISLIGATTPYWRYYNAYRDGEQEIILFGESPLETYHKAMYESFWASNKWNCVCGDTVNTLDPDTTTPLVEPNTVLYAYFSSDDKDFTNPYYVPAFAYIKSKQEYNEEADSSYCGVVSVESEITFNVTPHFLYEQEKYPKLGTPLKKGWVFQDYIGNAKNPKIPDFPAVTLLSFMSVAMHETGHGLGFMHFTDSSGAQYCDNDTTLDGVMKHYTNDIRRENLVELSLHDKCMMAKLYCPDLVVLNIFEYQPQTQKVYPNPGKYVVSFDFELPRYTEDLRMTVKDLLGQTLLIPIENAVYDAGKHTVLINVDSLAIGTYYIIIEAGAYRTVQPVMIVR